jgi:Glu-tRNA(Gln) amidotransferase subunit E-like FAD-binding protein
MKYKHLPKDDVEDQRALKATPANKEGKTNYQNQSVNRGYKEDSQEVSARIIREAKFAASEALKGKGDNQLARMMDRMMAQTRKKIGK